jgi:hypothetical protein
MTVINTKRDDSFEDWRLLTNADAANMGDITTIYTTDLGLDVTDTLTPSLTIGYGPNTSPITPVVTAINDLNDRKVKRSGDSITKLYVSDVSNATNINNGALIVAGGIGVAGNVYSGGNIYGTWAGAPIGVTKGGTGLSALGAANSVLGVNASATGAEYKALSSGDGTISFTMGPNSIDIRTSGTMTNAVAMNDTLIVGKQTLIGTWRGTNLGAITAGNAFEVRTFAGSTLTNLLSLATDYDNAAGATTVFNVSSTGNLTIGANKFTVAASSGNTAIAGTLTVSGTALFSTNATVSGNLGITGSLTVTGNTSINSGSITIADSTLEIGVALSGANDTTANNGGLILKGASDKTLLWSSTGANWTSSENFNLVANKVYKINNVTVLNNTTLGSGILYSSLTQVGTITSGQWAATTIPIDKGGTGQTTAQNAINALVPAGGTAGQALLTTGTSVYWGTPTASITIGNTINTTRYTEVGNGVKTLFTGIPTYTPGTGQLRVYINGVRQFPTTYTETSSTSVTLSVAPKSTDTVFFEIDGFINYAVTAASVTITAIGGLTGITNVQDALASLSANKANTASPTFTGTPASVTAAADTNSTQIATTAFVIGQLSNSNPLMDGAAAPGTSLKISRADHIHPTDTTRSPVSNPTFTGTVTFPVGTTTVAPSTFQAGSILTTPVAHSFEWDGTNLHITRSTAVRNAVVVADNGLTTWAVTVANASNASSASAATTATYLSSTQQTQRITGASNALNMAVSDSTNLGSFVARASGTGDPNLAGMTFWNDSYAIKMGVRADGIFGIGGWSRPAWSWYSDASGNMVASGNVTAYSDPRLKENVVRITSAVDKLSKLDGVEFTWKKGIPHIESKGGNKDLGVLANQVEAIFPEIITESVEIEGESYKTVCYEKLVPVLIEAIRELKAEIEALKK